MASVTKVVGSSPAGRAIKMGVNTKEGAMKKGLPDALIYRTTER